MASLYKAAAAVCLVAACGLQSAAADTKNYKFTAEDVTEEAYLAANLARNGQLPVHVSEVSEDKNIVTTLTGKVNSAEARTDATCNELIASDLKATFHHAFEYDADTSTNYRQFLQAALDKGLAIFDEEYFNGLIERTTLLKDMTADDLKLSVGNGAEAVRFGCYAGRRLFLEKQPSGSSLASHPASSDDPSFIASWTLIKLRNVPVGFVLCFCGGQKQKKRREAIDESHR
ncbi:uncharacterized protein EMH_0099340 [Eimeria mitis]|uniref:SAG family member n=1 Tax=Eimeria mitis TaxID=44415 RepID=U6JXA2_9EIME|nr:uncharacterized protein EMH_0099340 [Eimeria mitis]CDJ28153.1 hypothetical protein, conserved [Eimeria mitis]